MTYPHERMAADPHDRAGHRRADRAWLEERWAHPDTRVLVIAGSRIRARDGDIDWIGTREAPDGLRVLLGEHDGRTWFAVVDVEASEQGEWTPLRAVLPQLAGDSVALAPLVFHAMGVAEWLSRTRYCPRCGEPLQPAKSGHELVCANEHIQFPRSDPAVIMVVTFGDPGSEEERCLLGRQPGWPDGRYSTLAGFCEPGETLEDAVRREVAEEAGVAVGAVEYFGSQPWPFPASLMVGFVARALAPDVNVGDDELEDARWFTRAEMKDQAEAGTLVLPGGVSISRSLVEHWYGAPLPGQW